MLLPFPLILTQPTLMLPLPLTYLELKPEMTSEDRNRVLDKFDINAAPLTQEDVDWVTERVRTHGGLTRTTKRAKTLAKEAWRKLSHDGVPASLAMFQFLVCLRAFVADMNSFWDVDADAPGDKEKCE